MAACSFADYEGTIRDWYWNGLEFTGRCPCCAGPTLRVKILGSREFEPSCSNGCRSYEIDAALSRLVEGGRPTNGSTPPPYERPAATITEGVKRYPLVGWEEVTNIPDPVWQIEDLFQEQSLVQVYGCSNHGKSLFCLDVAANVAKGSPSWCGRRILKPGPVVWINADGGLGFATRVRAWKEANGDKLAFPFLTLMGNIRLNRNDEMLALLLQLQEMDPKPVLIVFDTLSRCIPGVDENNQAEMTRVTENCHRLKLGLGCTIILIHHTDKTGQWERGSSVVKAECDTQIRATMDEFRMLTIKSVKSRESEPFEDFSFGLTPVGESVVLTRLQSPTREDAEASGAAKALAEIRKQPGITREQLRLYLAVPATTCKNWVQRLLDAGKVNEEEAPMPPGHSGRPPRGLYAVD